MKMTIYIDENLLAKAQEISGLSGKNKLIEKALRTFIALESQKLILPLWGKVDVYDDLV